MPGPQKSSVLRADSPRRSGKWPIVIAAAFALLVLAHLGYQRIRFQSADRGFRSVTARGLPSNVVAVAHASEISDNMFHTTHYWELRGSSGSLRALAPAFGLERSDDDARYNLSDAQSLIPLGQSPQMLEGYEGSLDGGRDHWLLILAPGDRAVFVY